MQKRKNQNLTHGEEQIMQILWSLGSGNVNSIIDKMEEPKPAYTTVATFMKILEEKEFVGRKLAGRSYTYYPEIAKEDYAQRVLRSTVADYFNASIVELVSFYNEMQPLSQEEKEALQALLSK
ncbi:MAG: BlaI/MecI/CopY family transcriptional regulator [Alistipes sp.]|nr:BlaI/MecI/CopY family transcriptional regulator [Alistipes sp.]MBQ1952353.1 BlaI/MecI/CopY family transcriptional regulator [Alistipes sp.]MBQ1979234.1 BlaI/MecI/CopY family transcriptional regulator [Alistipes sp.]MBQ5619490.1 BlaI/MecI/CopY family transcriptional regulator [Alistipes sp.]MBQ5903036.1 BlaI/MecI/CopY family transcriptional regulator [Alistipes sp.]